LLRGWQGFVASNRGGLAEMAIPILVAVVALPASFVVLAVWLAGYRGGHRYEVGLAIIAPLTLDQAEQFRKCQG
jgi:hypothetical protein